jgi:hypothetical protein
MTWTSFPEEELRRWLVSFMNDNEDQLSIVHQQWDTLKSIEDELFRIKVKQDITVVLLCEYIQEWLNGVLKAIVNPP